MPSPGVIALARIFRDAILAHDKIALSRLIKAYGGIWARLQDKADLLALEIAGMDEVTPAVVLRMARYKELMAQTEKELTRFSGYMQTELITGTEGSIALGTRHAGVLLREAGLTGGFNKLPTSTIETMLGFLQDGSPLFQRIEALAPFTAKRVADALVEGIGLGMNPRTTAALIRNELGMGLTDALRMTRTAQLWSYREASRANYIANADVVAGWIWWADLPGEPCMSCVAMHGTEHPLTESLDDHYNGRCAELPLMRGEAPGQVGAGEDWFNSLDEAKQRELMGEARWDAWKSGKFDFADLSATEHDDVYGQMRVEASLEDLLAGLSAAPAQAPLMAVAETLSSGWEKSASGTFNRVIGGTYANIRKEGGQWRLSTGLKGRKSRFGALTERFASFEEAVRKGNEWLAH